MCVICHTMCNMPCGSCDVNLIEQVAEINELRRDERRRLDELRLVVSYLM